MDAVMENASGLAKGRRNMTSQVNARIETETKRAADVAFAHAGIAPSEVIRALYARAATLGSSLKSVEDLVVNGNASAEAQSSRKMSFERAVRAFDDMLTRYDFTVDVKRYAPMTEEEIEEAAYQDYLAGDTL
jgi:antitoxin component of RelBE/YafQ-DinJ toxin-antitoxin module